MNLKQLVHKYQLRTKILIYNSRKPKLKATITKKAKVKVVFFVLYDNMWKSDGLFKLLLSSDRFDPYIISSPYPHHPRKFSQENQSKLESFFKKKGFPYYNGYDFDKDEWFDIVSFNPDIVFYQQPYNTGYKGFKIESLWRRCLFGYIPYTYELEDNPIMVNGLLMNIAWKVFLPSDFEVKKHSEVLFNKGENLVATGSPLSDSLLSPGNETTSNSWKINDPRLKKVIWAPHHSILDSDLLHYSNFLDISDRMLEIATTYKDQIQFVFKPHPVLKRKLYKLSDWGQDRTDKYYAQWASLPNTAIVEGEYVDLFKSSDALIHDCSTFTAEYLFTKKPALFVAKNNQSPSFNEFGRQCYEMHYIGSSIEDIDVFLREVVLQGIDPMKDKRDVFFINTLVSNRIKDTAHQIFDVFCSEFEF